MGEVTRRTGQRLGAFPKAIAVGCVVDFVSMELLGISPLPPTPPSLLLLLVATVLAVKAERLPRRSDYLVVGVVVFAVTIGGMVMLGLTALYLSYLLWPGY